MASMPVATSLAGCLMITYPQYFGAKDPFASDHILAHDAHTRARVLSLLCWVHCWAAFIVSPLYAGCRPDFLGSYDHEDNRGTSTSSTDSDDVRHNGYRPISLVRCLTLPGALTVPSQLAFHPPAWHLPKSALGWSAVVRVVVRASPTRGAARLTDEACGTFGQVLETYAFQRLTGATVVIIGYCSVSLNYPLGGSLTACPDCH